MRGTPTTQLQVSLRFGESSCVVGELSLHQQRIRFSFDATFLEAPLPLSPFKLPAAAGVHEETRYTFEGVHGLFNDSIADGWGRRLLDREMARQGIERAQITPLDRLAYVGSDSMGALTYEPMSPREPSPTVALDLLRLESEAQQVLAGDMTSHFPELLALGSSVGGARPKLLLDALPDGEALPLLVKLRGQGDPVDIGAIEFAYARMARAAGIDMTRTWLLHPEVSHPGIFATQRFDRPDGHQVHIHSHSGLLHASHRFPSATYELLLKVTRHLTRDQQAVEANFRRMVFNIATHNRDDHSKNFAFQMNAAGEWGLTPAYDLTFSAGPGGTHWMALSGECSAPGRAHILSTASTTGVPAKTALAILEDVRAAVSRWEQLADESGVSRASTQRIGERLHTIDSELRTR